MIMNWFYECPYCGDFLPSRKTLRRHVGETHHDLVDDFMYRYRGGRIIPPHGIEEPQMVHAKPHITRNADRVILAPPSEKSPAQTAHTICEAGCCKTLLSSSRMFISAILAGVYIGFGAQLATTVTMDLALKLGVGLSNLIGGVVFSVGLMLVVLCGAELFTGNNLMLLSYYRGDITMKNLLKSWLTVYVGNYFGSMLLVSIVFGGGLFILGGGSLGLKALSIASSKLTPSFIQLLFRGIACNWLVCLAIWLASSSDDPVFKVLACLFPIMSFVASGFEHSVANMYFIPMGILLKQVPSIAAQSNLDLTCLTWFGFILRNLIPVTIGNIIGGAFFVSTIQWYIHIQPGMSIKSREAFHLRETLPVSYDQERDSVFIRLYYKLLEYVGSICDEVESICHENTARKELAYNIVENDRRILEPIIKEECRKRGWEKPNKEKTIAREILMERRMVRKER